MWDRVWWAGMTISLKAEAIVVAELMAGATHREAADEAGCCKATAGNVAERHAEAIETGKRSVQAKVLSRFWPSTQARLDDSADSTSRTGAASYRELRELLGWVPPRGPLVAIDQRSIHVNVEAGQVSALSGKTAAELEAALEQRMAELAGN